MGRPDILSKRMPAKGGKVELTTAISWMDQTVNASWRAAAREATETAMEMG